MSSGSARWEDDVKNDEAYNNRGYITGAEEYPPRWAAAAEAFRSALLSDNRAQLDLAYGPDPRERLDLFFPVGTPKGVSVFVHGGYWRLFDRSIWSHFASGCVARGWAVAVPSYPLAPQARIAAITQSAAHAVALAAMKVAGPVTLSGHSAGGHLVARMVCADSPLPEDIAVRLAAVVPISPVADLRPLIETSMNADFQLDQAAARAESPALLTKRPDIPVHILVGGDERPAFLDQARWLADAWSETTLEIAPSRHHFDVIDALCGADSALVMRLTP
ncbi:MAG: alpha/beta hydrolase [Pseudomonadota bacterium]